MFTLTLRSALTPPASRTALLAALLLFGMTLASCEFGTNEDPDTDPDIVDDVDADTNPCPQPPVCVPGEASCIDATRLEQCIIEPVNGCASAVTRDCTADGVQPGATCEGESGMAQCVGQTCQDECDAAGPLSCSDGITAQACELGPEGCLEVLTVPCNSEEICESGRCVPSPDPCAGQQRCPFATAGTYCTNDQSLIVCENVVGCLAVTSATDCAANGEFCNDDTAACEATCQDSMECSSGARAVCPADAGNSLLTCADTDEDGCLEYSLQPCDPGVCTDGACVPNGGGDTCDDAAQVLPGTTGLSGDQFNIDFADSLTLDSATCAGEDESRAEAIFELELDEGQTIVVSEHGPADVVISVVRGCADDEACLISEDLLIDESSGLAYTAEAAGTHFVVVESWAGGEDRAYDIRVRYANCGDGFVDPNEGCDDGNYLSDDGCVACRVELGWSCSSQPSLCKQAQDLGSVSAGEAVPPISGGPLAAGESDGYLIELTNDVTLSGTLDGNTTGDPDLYLLDQGGIAFRSVVTGPESFSWQVPAGIYELQVEAFVGGGTVDAYTLAIGAE